MFFSIDREIILEGLNIIQRGLPIKTPNPILTGIKLEVVGKELTIISSNTDISTKVVINDASLDVKTDGKIVVPGRLFIDIMRKISSKRVEIFTIEDKIININSERSEFKLNAMEVEYYPEIDFIDNIEPIKIDAKTIKTLVRETSFAAAINERRPILTGINLKYQNDQIISIATDSFRLSQKIISTPTNGKTFNIVIPNKSIDELSKVVENYNDDLDLHIDNNKILFKYKTTFFQIRLLEGNYPDTSRLIPTEYPIVIKFNREDLLTTIERVSLLSSKDREYNFGIIKLFLRKDHIVEITSSNSEVGGASEEVIPSDNVIGDSIQIAFSSRYLIEALKSFTSSEISINFTGAVKPFIVKGDMDKDLIHLILPVKFD